MGLHGELLLRILVATALGASIGWERQVHGRPAGLRTHMLVGLASATFMVVSSHFLYFQHYGKDDLVTVDTSRIAASVVAGTGFLAGGAILRTGLTVQGLTTGAGLWLVSAIGLSAGGGMYVESAAALSILRRFEQRDDHMARRRVSLEFDHTGSDAPVPAILAAVRSLGGVVSDAHYDRHVIDGRLLASLDVRSPADLEPATLLDALDDLPGIRRIRLEPLG